MSVTVQNGDICCLLRLAWCLLLLRGRCLLPAEKCLISFTPQRAHLLPAETCLMSVTAQRGISVACGH